MKRLSVISLIFVAFSALTSCGGNGSAKEPTDPIPATSCALVAGEWHLTDGAGNATSGYDIYLRLTKDGGFEMYQQLETMRYTKYSGTFAFADGTMSGRYDDGEMWRSSYTAVLNAKRTTLTLTSTTAPDNVSVFTRTAIPSEVFDRLAPDSSRCTMEVAVRFL